MTTTKKPQPDYLTQQDAQPNWGAFDSFVAPMAPEKVEQHAGILRTAGDMAIKGAQGVVDLGSSAIGLGSLATGGLVGQGMRAVGYDPKRTNEFLGEYLSDDQKASDAAVQSEDSFLGSAAAAITHPRALAGSIVESLPGMIAGMGASSAAARAIGTKAAAAFGGMETEAGARAAAAAIEQAGGKLMAIGSATEGAQSAGQIADDAQAAGRTYGQYAPAALAAGLGTAAIGFGAGKLMGDAATDIATGSRTLAGSKAAKVGKEFLSEGVLEEMPQSAQEQYFTNIAQGEKDVFKGVANAAGSGLVTGGVMGAGMGLIHGDHAAAPAPAPLADTGPLSRAANAVQAAAATQAAIAAAAAPTAPAATTAPANLPPLADIDARMAQLVAIGHGAPAQRTADADGNRVDVPAVPGRRLTPEEIGEFNSLKAARAARVAIPQDQQAEYDALLTQEQAARDQKYEPAKQAAAANRAATEQAAAQGQDDAEHAQITAMVHADDQLRAQTELVRQQQDLDDIAARVERERTARADSNRAALRDDVLANASIPAEGKKAAFAAALKRKGYRIPVLNETDHQEIDAHIAAGAPLPTLPNELVDAVPERKPAAPVASAPNTQAVDAAIAAGMRLKTANGTVLHKPGSTKIFRLSTAQRAYYDKAIARQATAAVAPAAQIAAAEPQKAGNMQVSGENMQVSGENDAENAVSVPAAAPLSHFDAAAHEAATSPHNELAEPTEAQKEAGNYKVGRVKLHGLDISIENPTGSVRRGVDKAGKPWETTMNHHYGYIRGTVGADKDHIDTFIGPNHDSDKVFVVDQIHPDSGKFDEHKIMLGFDTLAQAHEAYKANYDANWTGGRDVAETTIAGFKEWLASGNTKKEFAKSSAALPTAAAPTQDVPQQPADRKMPADYTANTIRNATAWGFSGADLVPDASGHIPAAFDNVEVIKSSTNTPNTALPVAMVHVAQAPNGKWTSASSYLESGSGRMSNVGAQSATPAYETRDAAIRAELDRLKDEVKPKIHAELVAAAGLEATPAPAGKKLTKQDLNKMTVKDMTDDQLLQAKEVFEGQARAPKIAKELAARGLTVAPEADQTAPQSGKSATKAQEPAAKTEAPLAIQQPGVHQYEPENARPLLLIACSDTKLEGMHRAVDLYKGVMFDVLRKWQPTENRPDIYILSAKHGIVHADTLLESYEQPMTKDRLADLMSKRIDPAEFEGKNFNEVYIAGSAQYRQLGQHYIDQLRTAGYIGPDAPVDAPPNGAGIGDQRGHFGDYLRKVDMRGPANAAELSDRLDAEHAARKAGKTAPGQKLENATAPEHVVLGVDDRELAEIVDDFNGAQAEMMDGEHAVSNIFQPPKKREVVRLADKSKGKLWDPKEVKAYNANLEKRDELIDAGEPVPAELAKQIADFEAVYLPHVARLLKEAKAEIGTWKEHAQAQGENAETRRANGRKIVLSLFDLSGEWSKPWEEAGYQVYRFDIQDDPEVGDVNNFSTGFFGDWFGDFDGLDVHAILAATPCTDFAVSGARHFAAKDADGRTVSSVKLVHQTLRTIEYFKPPVWALENPVGRIEKLGGLPPWRLAFDPNHLGDPYTKKTLLWGRFNADLPVAPVEPTEGSKMHKLYGGKSMATKNARSVTPEGFSYGFFMANNVIDHPAMAIANKYDRLDRAGIERAVAAGVTEDQINEAVEDFYYMDLDDTAANEAIHDLTTDARTPDPAPAPTKSTKSTKSKATKEAAAAPAAPAPVRPADIKTYTAKEAQAEWTDSREYKRGVVMARVDRRDLAAKSWEELTADERKLAHEALDGDFDSPSWYINNKGVQINKGSMPAIAQKSDAELADERGAQHWAAIHPNERHSALLNLGMGIGEQADQAKYSQWHQMGAEVRAGLVAQFDRKAQPQAGSAEDLPAPTNAEAPAAERTRGANNKIFTAEAAEKARAVLRAKLGQLNSGIDPELMQAGIMLAGFHIEAGARSFIDFSRHMIADIGENMRPFLRSFYEGVRHYPGIDGKDMTPGAEIDAILAAEAAPVPAPLAKVVGTAPKVEKKSKAEPGNAALRGDYGVEHIDGYAETDEFPADNNGDYPKGGVKGAFLKNAQRYLKDVAGNLMDHGYAPPTDGKGKAMKPVNSNESGTVTAGDVSLAMFNAELGKGIYVHVGASALRGTVPTSKSGLAVMMRVTDAGNPYGGGQNLWMDPGLTARDLAENITEAVAKFAPRQKSATLDTNASTKEDNGHIDTGRESAETLGAMAPAEDGAAESIGRVERGDAGSGRSGVQADRGSDGAGVPGPRGGRGRAGGSHPAGTGTAAGGRLAGAGTGRNGKRVSGQDARASLNDPVADAPAPSAPNVPAVNFRITDDVRLGQGGEVEKFNDNLAAIRTMRAIEAENRRATPAEQAVLARYVGWGGLANAFPSPETGDFKDAWRNRGPELAELLSPKEYALARRSTLDSHYTSKTVVDSMWTAARHLGFKGGMALESSMGSGNFVGLMPQDIAGNTKFIGVEYDNLTARIATLLYPRETVLNSGFQDVPLSDGAFDLAIGNPPFGEQSLRFQFKPEINGHSIHNQFFLASLDALKPGGLQVQVVSRYLLDKMDKSSRVMLAKKAKLLGAIRLPDTAFKENARTSVVTDILFLQRLTPAEEANMAAVFTAAGQKTQKSAKDELERAALAAQVPDWVNTTAIADPLGGEPMPVNTYFARNPSMIMGVQERSGKMAHGNDITVRLDQAELAGKLARAIEALPQDAMVQDQSAIDAAIARHKDMSDALRIALAGHENGSIKLEAGGVLEQVTERETPEGSFELTKRTLSAVSPWSDALYMNSAGQWYTIEAQIGEDGKPVKLVKDGKTTKLNVYDRKVFASEADIPSGMLLGQARYERLKELVALRDLLKEQLSMEAENAPDAAIEANRSAMAGAYKAFVKAHGLISEPSNSSLMSNMPDGALVQALEFSYRPAISAARAARIKEKVRPSSATPAPILSKRVIVPYAAATSADSVADAIAINMAESGRVDIERIASLLGKTVEQIEGDIAGAERPLLFKDPEGGQWETRNDYLSGQVKRKLNAARAARMTQNIIALEEVQPEAWGAENVTALLGSSWVPPAVYANFVEHISGAAARVSYSAVTNSYSVNGTSTNRANEEEWASPGYSTIGLISDLLNNHQIKVMYHDSEGNAHIHAENTALALLKAKAIAGEFTDWVYKDGARRNQLVDIFNEKFNTRVNRQHDGSHLILPGKVPDAVIGMRRHQKNTIWRGIAERFMLVDHAVGAGKTFTAIARAMERRRMGLSKKPAIIVPNHMVDQFTSDVYRLYPGAKVLAAGKKDFEKSRRRKLFAKIATGDFDIVIIPHSSFGFIGIAPETEERYLQVELDAATEAVQDAQAEADANGEGGFRKPFGVKEAERLVDKITARMEKVAGDKSKDRLLTFEQMGIDDLTVDEAHEFKNLFYSSRLTGVKGMGNKTGSQKAFDLYNKVRVLRESQTGTVTFMTGTPISNSAVEMYNMMRYLAADELRELGLEHFDAWRAQFVSTDAGWEPTETGRLKEVNRLGRTWSNMRSLMDLYYSFTDSVDNDDIKKAYAEDNNGEQFPIPRVTGGDRQSVVIEPTKAQLGLLNSVLEGFDALPNITDPYERNIARLRLMDRARKVSLDVRAAEPSSKSDEKGGKLDVLSDNVKRIYDKWDKDRGTQLVFLDRSVPKAKGDDTILKEYDALQASLRRAFEAGDENEQRRVGEKLERFDTNEMEAMRSAQAGGWNAYQQIKDNLIARGIPAAEIRFIQEANNDAQKQALFDAVNDGTVRVLIGSTPRMGAGTNVQQRIVAIHHADVTWKPSDIEQREGRGIRQGNKLLEKYGIDKFELEILAYATERTIDAKMWSLNASKLKTINAIRKYDGAFSMDFEDEDSVSMAELAALASGDPLLLERVKLMSEIDKLELLKRQHARKEWGITGQIEDAENAINTYPARVASNQQDLAAINAGLAAMEEDAAGRSVRVEGTIYTDGTKARTAVYEAVKAQQGGDEKKKVSISVDGRRLASLEGAMAAVGSVIGDQQTFLMAIGGKDLIARTDAARAAAEIATTHSEDLDPGQAVTVDIGQFRGLTLQATMERDARSTYTTSLAVVRADGSTMATGDTKPRENAEYTTMAMRTAVEDLEKTLNPQGIEWTIGNLQRRIAAAHEALPNLLAKKGGGFAQQDELDAKNARLEAVIRDLSSGPSTPARAITLRSNPLQNADGSYVRQAPALAFSRSRVDSADPLVNIFSQIAQDDAAFRMPGSDGKTLGAVVADMAPGLVVDEFMGAGQAMDPKSPVDRVWSISDDARPGMSAWVYRNNKNREIWLDISNWKEGRLGSEIYQAVATFAKNTGHTFIGDPQGLSDKALYRRTEHMISSALRHGTTEHLAPHARQHDIANTAGTPMRPIQWREGDHAHNLREMLVSSYTNILQVFPEIADVQYNFASGRFERLSPVRASGDELWADESAPGEHVAGEGAGSGDARGAVGRGADGRNEGAGQLGRVDANPFTDEDFATVAKSVRDAYDTLFPSARGAFTPPLGVSDLKRAALVGTVLRQEGSAAGRAVLDHVSDRLLQRVSPQLRSVLYSRDAEYFRDDGNFLPAIPAGVDAGAAAPLELTGRELLDAKKSTEQLNRELAKAGMEPVRALRVAPNANFALARQIGETLGIKVNFVSKSHDFEGVAYNGIAYMADGMRNAELAIAGHETLHALEQSNPALGAKLRTQIRAYLKDGTVEERQAREYAASGFQDVSHEQAEAEVIADINGAMWMDPVFWGDLAKADRSLFRAVAYKFMEVATKAIKSLRGSRFDVSALVRDVEAVRAIMVSTWAEHNAGRDRAAAAQNASWAPADGSVAPEQQLSKQALHELANAALAGLDNAPPVFVLESPEFLLAHGIRVGAVPVSAGAMIDGKIFLFQNGIRSAAKARVTIWHELFHYGLRKLMTPEAYASTMTGLYNSDEKVKTYAQRWASTEDAALRHAAGISVTDMHLISIEEGLANIAEQLKAGGTEYLGDRSMPRTVRNIIVWMAKTAERMGLTKIGASLRGMTLSEGEKFVASVFARTSDGEQPPPGNMADLDRRSINFAPGEPGTPAFERWFGDSMAVDASGAPLPVYHGTPTGGFSVFDKDRQGSKGGRARGGFSFTTDYDAAESYATSFGDEQNTTDALLLDANAIFAKDVRYTDDLNDALNGDYDAENPLEWSWQVIDSNDDLRSSLQQMAEALEADGQAAPAAKLRALIDKEVTSTPEVKTVYLKVPKGSPVYHATAATLGQVVQGLDVRSLPTRAAIVELDDGSKVFYVADSEQIKSATDNNGEFDPGNPDIAFSRAGLGGALASAAGSIADVRLPAGYRIGDAFNAEGKINWWHKTIGTMDNLAKRAPAFAKVYEAVQSFLGDVSRFAVVAADLAPTLLPKLENISDIIGKNRKKALTAADTKAIGAPIFEGTLVWARDAHGKPVKIAELEAQAERLTTGQKAQILIQKGVIDDAQNQAWLNNPLDFYDKIIEGKFAETQLKAGVVWSDAELRSMFNLADGQVALYHEFRNAIDKSLTNLTISEMVKLGGKDAKGMIEQAVAAPNLAAAADLLRDHFIALAQMHPEMADMHLDTAKQILNLGDKGQDLMDRGYAPLSRFGKYTVYVQAKNDQGENEQVYFGMFETQYEASKMARDMGAEHPDAQVSQGTISEDAYKLFAGVSPETIELFGSMVGLDSQASAQSTEVYQTYLKLAKNNRSSMKRLIHRKGIAGFSEDAGRVLAGFVYSNARLTAGNAHLGEIDEAITEIPKQQGELTDAAMQLREHIRNPEGGGSKLGGLMFAQFLGGSVASAMVNLTQPFTMTLPFLSQWGGIGKAGKRLAGAIRDARKESTGDAGLDAALQWASDEGIVAPQEVHYLQAQAQGKGGLRSGDGTRAGNTRAHLNNAMSKVALGWGKLFAMAELTNRRVTFIAAYRTAVEENQPNPERFAQQAVSQTQGIYNSGNKPKWARGAIGGLLLTFKQYSVGYLELLSRMAFAGEPGSKERAAGRRAALYMVAVLFLMGGADGLPFEQDLEDALDGILQRLGYNFSSKRSKQAFLTNVLGQGGADFALKGISAMPGMPVDVAGRFGMGNLIPGTGLLTKKPSYTSDLGELAGPAGDLAKRAFSASGKALGGDLLGAAMDLSPASVRNVAKGIDMLDTGTYRDARGYIVNNTTPSEAVMKMIGFQPNSTADVQDQKGQALNMIGQNRMRSTEIAEHWAQGLANANPAMVQEARDMRADWNAKNPETPIKVDLPAIIRRVRAMKQDAIMRTQKTAPAALKQTVRAELASTRE
jgi:N12 class adenine-specific DNA methylase